MLGGFPVLILLGKQPWRHAVRRFGVRMSPISEQHSDVGPIAVNCRPMKSRPTILVLQIGACSRREQRHETLAPVTARCSTTQESSTRLIRLLDVGTEPGEEDHHLDIGGINRELHDWSLDSMTKRVGVDPPTKQPVGSGNVASLDRLFELPLLNVTHVGILALVPPRECSGASKPPADMPIGDLCEIGSVDKLHEEGIEHSTRVLWTAPICGSQAFDTSRRYCSRSGDLCGLRRRRVCAPRSVFPASRFTPGTSPRVRPRRP